MPISVECPACHGRLRLPDNATGKRFRCPKCKGVIVGPTGSKPSPTIRPKDALDPGFVDAPYDPEGSAPIDEPMPISQAAKRALHDYNPFASTSDSDEEDEKPKKSRYYQPKDDYNPFDDPAREAPAESGADPGRLFDFGQEDPSATQSPGDDLNFGSPEAGPPRKRR